MRLILEDDHSASDDPLRFERRQADRRPAFGAATLFVCGGTAFGRQVVLHLQDTAAGGLGGRCDDPIAPGTPVTVEHPVGGLQHRHGHVVRCEPCGNGYRVGIAFRRAMAA